MDTNLKNSLWHQFGAAIEYLGTTLDACPDELWRASLWDTHQKPRELAQVWYVLYHTLFWLDLYLTGTEDGFLPPTPFSLIEQNEEGPIPKRAYTKAELQDYFKGCRTRAKATIDNLTDKKLAQHCWFGWGECSFLELIIYNLRHVQEHSGQVNMLLGQNNIETPDYPTQVKN